MRDSFRIQSFETASFDFASRDIRVDGFFAAELDLALDRNHEFGAQLLRAPVRFRLLTFIEDQLRDPVPVTNVDEDDAAQVAAAMDPTHQERWEPASAARSSPQKCDRRRSPKKSSFTSAIYRFIGLLLSGFLDLSVPAIAGG